MHPLMCMELEILIKIVSSFPTYQFLLKQNGKLGKIYLPRKTNNVPAARREESRI